MTAWDLLVVNRRETRFTFYAPCCSFRWFAVRWTCVVRWPGARCCTDELTRTWMVWSSTSIATSQDLPNIPLMLSSSTQKLVSQTLICYCYPFSFSRKTNFLSTHNNLEHAWGGLGNFIVSLASLCSTGNIWLNSRLKSVQKSCSKLLTFSRSLVLLLHIIMANLDFIFCFLKHVLNHTLMLHIAISIVYFSFNSVIFVTLWYFVYRLLAFYLQAVIFTKAVHTSNFLWCVISAYRHLVKLHNSNQYIVEGIYFGENQTPWLIADVVRMKKGFIAELQHQMLAKAPVSVRVSSETCRGSSTPSLTLEGGV